SNNLNEEAAKYLAQLLLKSQNLTSLELGLYNNNIGYQGANLIALSLKNNQKITYLRLNFQQLIFKIE
ncbi:kinase domain protein, partial (macronuclear) [Tetrahymena thermophila SB210]